MEHVRCIEDKYGALIPIDKITYINKDCWVSCGGERREISYKSYKILMEIFKLDEEKPNSIKFKEEPDAYTESELCRKSPYELCKILEGHSDRITVSDDYADLLNDKRTYRMYKYPRLFGGIGYDIVEFETGKKPYISYHWGLGEDPYIKEDDDEFTHIVPDEYRESVIKVLIDGILKRQLKKA